MNRICCPLAGRGWFSLAIVLTLAPFGCAEVSELEWQAIQAELALEQGDHPAEGQSDPDCLDPGSGCEDLNKELKKDGGHDDLEWLAEGRPPVGPVEDRGLSCQQSAKPVFFVWLLLAMMVLGPLRGEGGR